MPRTKRTPKTKLPAWVTRLISVAKFLMNKTGFLEIIHLFTLLSARYLPNRSSVYVSELFLPILLLTPLILLTYHLFYRIFKQPLLAHIASFSMLYTYFHFEHHYEATSSLVNALSPFRLGTTLEITIGVIAVKLILSGIFAFAAGVILRYFNIYKLVPVMKLFGFVIVFIFASQAYKIIDFNLRISDQTTFTYQIPDYKQDKSKITTKPDIYYFVFDRYASNAWLKDEYGFDNSEINNFLRSEGFTVKEDALSNYPFTGVSVSSTLAMEYHDAATGKFKEKLTTFPIRSILNNPPVAQLLKKNGYAYFQNASWWGSTADRVEADTNLTSKGKLKLPGIDVSLTEFQELFNDKSVGSYLYQPIIKNVKISEFERPIEQLNNLGELLDSSSTQPKFVFSHVLLPHPPYLHDENGESPAYDINANDNDVDEKVKYINQLKYANVLIKDVITAIRTKSPNAIIIMQADEGPYPKEMRGKNFNQLTTIEELSDRSLYSKYAIQAAYYFPNPSSATRINSSVDAFRVTLSDYLGYDMPSLPSCQYSGRSLVNQRLGVALSPDCPKYDE